MANNKVVYGNQTIMDITDTTAEAADVASGKYFYGKDGIKTSGTADYMSKVSNPRANDILITDASGQAVDSGVPIEQMQDVFVAEYGVTSFSDIVNANNSDKIICVKKGSNEYVTVRHPYRITETEQNLSLDCALYMGTASITRIIFYVDKSTNEWTEDVLRIPWTKQATADTLGTMKLNPSQSIDMDAEGHLTVGGRMGQYPTTTGIYAPNDRDPRMVADYDLLFTDALGMNMTGNRSLAVVSGLGVTCKSAAAGATEYRVTNNYTNRILCKLAEGGFASRDEATSNIEQIVQVTSVTINGSSFTPDSSANSSNDIVIKTATTLNPNSAITSIRLFGTMGSYASVHTGNGIKSESGGRNLLLGGGVIKAGSSNDNCLVGNGIYSNGNGVAAFGRYHILRKNRGFFAGTGHDSTNAPSEGASAVGQYSFMDANTLFAVGVGSSQTDRKNAFEVRSDGLVLRSPNGTRFKVAVDDSGNISSTAI